MNVKIIAESIEEFKKIEEEIQKLDTRIRNKIETAEYHPLLYKFIFNLRGECGENTSLDLPKNPKTFIWEDGNLRVTYEDWVFIFSNDIVDSHLNIDFCI